MPFIQLMRNEVFVKRNKLTEMMIRAYVNKVIREIQDDPERGFQSLIELGNKLGDRQTKRAFLDRAAKELHNKNSVYYKLLENTFCRADAKAIAEFGINIGYHSLTAGIQELRENANKKGCKLPWTIFFDMSWGSYPSSESISEIIRQGKELGIYCYMFHIDRKYTGIQSLLELFQRHSDCANILFLYPDTVSRQLAARIVGLKNTFVFLKLDNEDKQEEKEAVNQLLNGKCLCGGFLRYSSQSKITGDETFLQLADNLGLPFLCMMSNEKFRPPGIYGMKKFVGNNRDELKTPVFPIDLWEDIADIGRSAGTGACLLTVSGCDQIIVTDMEQKKNTGGIAINRPLNGILTEYLKRN